MEGVAKTIPPSLDIGAKENPTSSLTRRDAWTGFTVHQRRKSRGDVRQGDSTQAQNLTDGLSWKEGILLSNSFSLGT